MKRKRLCSNQKIKISYIKLITRFDETKINVVNSNYSISITTNSDYLGLWISYTLNNIYLI